MRRRDFLLALAASAAAQAGVDRESIGANTAMRGYGLFDAVDALRRLGFATIEIQPMGVPEARPDRFPGFEFDRMAEPDRRKLRRALTAFRHVTVHLPYSGLAPFDRDQAAAAAAEHKIRSALEASAYFGAELAVLHVVPPRQWTFAEARPSIARRIREWGDYAASHGFTIGIETGFPASVREFVGLVKDIGHDAVGCTIDVGHQRGYRELASWTTPQARASADGVRAYNDVTHAIIDGLGARILHFHVHDIDPATWAEHKPIGTDFVDYRRLMTKLRRIAYRGRLVLEIAAPAADIEPALEDSRRRLAAFL
jgi:sugar phosphate isomerase/epimerase